MGRPKRFHDFNIRVDERFKSIIDDLINKHEFVGSRDATRHIAVFLKDLDYQKKVRKRRKKKYEEELNFGFLD